MTMATLMITWWLGEGWGVKNACVLKMRMGDDDHKMKKKKKQKKKKKKKKKDYNNKDSSHNHEEGAALWFLYRGN